MKIRIPAVMILALLAVTASLDGCKRKSDDGAAPAEPPASGAAAAAAAPAPPVFSSEIDACALLTSDEIKAVVGKEVGPAGHGAAGVKNICEYELDGGSQVMSSVYASSARETFDAGPGDPLAGVGDAAKWYPPANMLSVLSGDKAFTIGIVVIDDTPPEKTLEQVKALAEKILGRL